MMARGALTARGAFDPTRRWLDVAASAHSWYLSLVEKDQERHW